MKHFKLKIIQCLSIILLPLLFQACDGVNLGGKLATKNIAPLKPDPIEPNPSATPTANPSPTADPGIGFSKPTSTNCEYYRTLWGVDDEYFCEQWHLINRGVKIKKVPATTLYNDAGVSGADIKIETSRKTYNGDGVRIYITDDGLFFAHPDINANYISGYNNCTGADNSTPANTSDNHGTMVSGIIAAVAGNQIGVSGVSPGAKIFVNNYISCQTGTSNMIKAVKADASYNIWSGSFGIGACSGFIPRSQYQSIYDAYSVGASQNLLYFKANGNDNSESKCIGIGNTDPSNGHYAVASIAALDNSGKITSYSTRGPNLSLSGFAGYGGSSSSPGIVTISQSSSYTSNMNGTSAATPVNAGSAALLLDAVPGRKWYEYQVILLRSATRIDETLTSSSGIPGVNNQHYLINDAGYRHSYSYGLGAVNVDAAIDLAKTSNISLPELKRYSDVYGQVPTSDTTEVTFSGSQCAEKTINVASDMQIYSAEISFDISIAAIKDLALFMVTPKGKIAQLMRTSKIPGANLTHGQYFKSMQPFAMKTAGAWKFKACGVTSGTFKNVKLNFYGFNGTPIPERI